MRILLLGPTAVGKTSLSVQLASQINAEIISADSRQCYQYMNIGTATPSFEEREDIPHYNLSIIDPSEKDSVAKFHERSLKWEKEVGSRDKNILYVGGSTLHVQSIIQPLDDVPSANEANLRQLEQRAKEEGIEELYEQLKEVDPDYVKKMDGMNTQRIIRALDVWMQTGRPFSSFHSDNRSVTVPNDLLVFGLRRERKELYDRINRRVDMMLEQGFFTEVKEILSRGYTLKDPGLNTVGYKQAIAHLEGRMSKDQMVKDMKAKTRQYAKRQLSWFRRWEFIHWIDIAEISTQKACNFIREQLAAKSNKV